jgi:GNAT superfamily N-acetyltransferase
VGVPTESIRVGRCYLTDAARVQRVLEITPDGKVIHAHRSTRSWHKAWTPGTASLRAFASISVREVPCDWTPEIDDLLEAEDRRREVEPRKPETHLRSDDAMLVQGNAPPSTLLATGGEMNAESITIFSFEAGDAGQCARVFHRAWNSGHPYAPREIGVDEFLAAIRDRSVIVAQSAAGQIIGFAGVYVPGQFIHHLYVDPVWTGCGVGSTLLAHALALAGGQATLKCQVRNERALRFYDREGWTPKEQGETDGEPWLRLKSPVQ